MDNEQNEREKGRVAVWLDPEDITFLANEWRKMPNHIDEKSKEIWERIAFRLMTALHKSGIKYEAKFPTEKERYK